MARPEDKELQKQIDELNKKLDARKRKTDSYYMLEQQLAELYERQAEIQERQVNSKKAQVKVGQANLKISKEVDRTEALINKSFATRISQLMKGNVIGALGLGQTKKHEKAQQNLALQHQKTAQAIQQGAENETVKAEVLDIAAQVQSGILTDATEISKMVEEATGGVGIQSNIMDDLLSKKDAENTLGISSADSAAKLTKRLGIAGAVFGALLAVAQKFAGSVDAIGKQFGSLNVLSQGFQKNLFDSQEAVVGLGATMEDVVSTANELSSEFGIGLEESADLSAQIIDTAKAVGLSNEEAAKLSGILQVTSGLSSEQAERLSEGAFQLAAANNVNPSAVLKDMAASSEDFAQFSKDGGDNLARAAVQARAMGLSLADTSKIASGLLDFEQSIAAEVEASVLIGRQLNLQKARELALNNDIEGAMRAVVDQLGSEAEFNELNSIQRDALAKSIGVEASQLAKMVANSEKASVAADETAKSFSDIIGKEAMSELTATMNELKIFGVAIANTLGPLLMGLAKLVNVLLVPLGNMVAGLSGAIRGTFADAVTMNDGVVGRGGISMMAGPAGVFSLNPRDSVMATTNPIPVNDVRSGPAGSMGGTGKQTIVMNARVRGRDLVFLNDRPNAVGDAGYEGLA